MFCQDPHAVSDDSTQRHWHCAAEILLIFLIFFIHAGWPAPDVNEPHYLGKAKHYWNPDWAEGDFFLGTADAHTVFYFTSGWLTLWLPLPAVAWIGRSVTWLLLAWAWRRLSTAIVVAPLFSVLSAAVFVSFSGRCHMAGEWVVGGFEAKGFAYVMVFLGLEALVRDRWGRALICFGGAAAFHVIVGGWAVVATMLTWWITPRRPALIKLVVPATVGGLLSLGGVWPGLQLTWSSDPEVVAQANQIYVYGRFNHHLLPPTITTLLVVRLLLLTVALVPLSICAPASRETGRLRAFVAAAIAIAALGFLLGIIAWWQPVWAAGLLRYYWFRLADVMVPLAAALLTTSILSRWQRQHRTWFAAGVTIAILASAFHLGDTVRYRLEYLTPRADWTLPRIDLDEWRQVADWANQHTPPDSVFLVPRLSQTFRWYSGRGEVVTRKDLPQDAASIVEWWQRLNDLGGQDIGPTNGDSLASLGATRILRIANQYGASYLVTRLEPTLGLMRVGPDTQTIAVYQLPSAESH
jgi:hypothetical protein